MEKIKLFIIDDHQIVRDGLKALFDKESGIFVIGESGGKDSLKELFSKNLPDVVLLDISLGDISGIDLLKEIQNNFPSVHVIMLSMYNDEQVVFSAIESGAKGYLPKTTSKEEIIKAIKEVYNNKKYFNEQITQIMLDGIVNQKKKNVIKDDKPGISLLTNREIQLLKLFAEGLTNQDIAQKLFLSIRTVESHKTHIMQKLELRTAVELVKFAIKNNLADI